MPKRVHECSEAVGTVRKWTLGPEGAAGFSTGQARNTNPKVGRNQVHAIRRLCLEGIFRRKLHETRGGRILDVTKSGIFDLSVDGRRPVELSMVERIEAFEAESQ